MGESRLVFRRIASIGIVLGALVLGCSDDDENPVGPQMITISGTVRNIDTATPAAGVRVTLFESPYSDTRPTGTDGKYSIQVPAGSKLLLYTDDFDLGTDAWFPLINTDVPTITVDQLSAADRAAWPIHCCPQTHAPAVGSVAFWDDYLANADNQTGGDIYAAETCARSGGIVSIVFANCSSGVLGFLDSMAVSTSSAAFPMGYMREEVWLFGTEQGPNVAHPAGWTGTDSCGIAASIGDSSATDSILTLTITDLKSSRGFIAGPYDVPVRHGTISLILATSIDGVVHHFKETAICGGWITPAGAPRMPTIAHQP